MVESQLSNRLAVGIISFNPTANLVELCRRCVADGLAVTVFDNASTTGQEWLDASRLAGATVEHNDRNVGVSGGLVALVARVRAEWLIVFDQDSLPVPGYAAVLLSMRADDPRVALIGPLVYDIAGRRVVQGRPGEECVETSRVITSGAAHRTELIKEVGIDESLFIDFVDHDLCSRLRTAGYVVLIQPKARLDHSIGRERRIGSPTVGLTVSDHSELRLRYRYRNFVHLIRVGSLRDDPRWLGRTMVGMAVYPAKICIGEASKAAKLKAILAGVREGLGR